MSNFLSIALIFNEKILIAPIILYLRLIILKLRLLL